jgi:hypothetical protein
MNLAQPPFSLFLIVVVVFVALGCLYGAFYFLSRKRIIDDTPTSKTQGVFIGRVELKGTAESETPLVSYLAGVRCVVYEWTIDEEWSKLVTETYQDANGNTQTRTRTESGWTNVGRGGEGSAFYLRDDTGVLRVEPKGASIEASEVMNKTIRRGDLLYYTKGPPHDVMNSSHKRRFHETAIPLHSSIYVLGKARERMDVIAAEVAYDENEPLFLISTETEKHVSGEYGLWYILLLITGFATTMLGSMVASQSTGIEVWLGPALLYLIATSIGWLWVIYNSMISLRNGVDYAWSLLDVQLKRRNDLIPNIMSIVENYSGHERETQGLVAELRAQSYQTSDSADSMGITQLVRIIAEGNPDILAEEAFLHLQMLLEETEQRIALARDYFNELAFFYNTRLVVMPDNLVGKMAGMRTRSLFKAKNFERAPLDVRLAD